MMMMATDLIRHSVVGSRDGLEDVLHDEGEGREAADHEEVGDGALKDEVNPILTGLKNLTNLLIILQSAAATQSRCFVMFSF